MKFYLLAWATILCSMPGFALAAPLDQAKRLHDRLVGIPPSQQVLAQMTAFLQNGNGVGAALLAMDNDYFYNVMLRNWFSTWTNVAQDARIELNDFSATLIGVIRDNLGFDQALYGDFLYTADDSLVSTLDANGKVVTQRQLTPYQNNSNQHYIDLTKILINPANLADLSSAARTKNISLRQFLVKKQQSNLTGISDTAGIITSRAFGEAYFSAGTNRRAVRFVLKNFLCMDMPQLEDTSRADFHVRRDVDRTPGGDSRTFKQTCVGCHAGMDGMAGAFARFDFNNNQVVNTPTSIQSKYNKNSTVFPSGYITTDDSWVNLWVSGPNASLGWHGNTSGNGARSWGKMITQTDAFSQCMVKRVFSRVCLRDPQSAENELIQRLANDFSANGKFNMRDLFAAVATLPQCMGD